MSENNELYDTIKGHINRNVIQCIKELQLTDRIRATTINTRAGVMRSLGDDFIEDYLKTLKKYGIESKVERTRSSHITAFEINLTPTEFLSLLKLYQLL